MQKKLRALWRTMTGEKIQLTAILLILFGCLLRLLFLEQLPYGLNQDEASAGYEAWALLHSGVDRNLKSWPVLLVAWGSGQNALMTYLAIPWVAIFGLNPMSIRLPNAIAGCITLFFMWRLASRARGERFGLLALFLLVINPWHIMANRWGLEGNLLPMLLWGACYFFSWARQKPKMLIGAAICLGLAPYAYGTVFFLLPFFLLWALWELRKSLKPGWTIAALAIFVVIALPIALCQAINMLGLEEIHVGPITLPLLTQSRQNATSVFGEEGLAGIPDNISVFLGMLQTGDDGDMYNTLPFWRGGIFYFFGFPLAVLGIIVGFKERKERREEWPVLALLCCACLCAALIRGNINRMNMAWLPMIYYSAVGADWLIRQLRIRKVFPLIVAMASFLYFGYSYISTFAYPGGFHVYFPGLGEAMEAALEMEHETLYVSETVRQPYVFALFYGQIPPEEFAQSVVYSFPDSAFRRVERFTGFEFMEPEGCDLLVLTEDEAEEQGREIVRAFDHYVICR